MADVRSNPVEDQARLKAGVSALAEERVISVRSAFPSPAALITGTAFNAGWARATRRVLAQTQEIIHPINRRQAMGMSNVNVSECICRIVRKRETD
jgi:hypothetical protein